MNLELLISRLRELETSTVHLEQMAGSVNLQAQSLLREIASEGLTIQYQGASTSSGLSEAAPHPDLHGFPTNTERVKEAMIALGGAGSVHDICAEIRKIDPKVNVNSINSECSIMLHKKGLLDRVGKGIYRLRERARPKVSPKGGAKPKAGERVEDWVVRALASNVGNTASKAQIIRYIKGSEYRGIRANLESSVGARLSGMTQAGRVTRNEDNSYTLIK